MARTGFAGIPFEPVATSDRLNNASQDFPRHLAILREHTLHPTDYERAIHYFLEEFAADTHFLGQCDPDQAPGLLAVITQVVSRAMHAPTRLESASIFLLREHGFFHGHAKVADRRALFFFIRNADTGVLALIPGRGGEMEVARFRLTQSLPDPRQN